LRPFRLISFYGLKLQNLLRNVNSYFDDEGNLRIRRDGLIVMTPFRDRFPAQGYIIASVMIIPPISYIVSYRGTRRGTKPTQSHAREESGSACERNTFQRSGSFY